MIHVAIWGTGDIARAHTRALLENKDLCEITALINHKEDRAKKLIDTMELPQDLPIYTTFEEAVQKEAIDAVCILLPPHMHKDAAIEAASHGIHVLVEKPMANSLEECDAMIAAAKENRIVLMTICQRRFSDDVQKVRGILETGAFGKIRFSSVESFWYRGEHYHDLNWRGSWRYEGGGVLTSQALHHLDLLEYIHGVPKSVSAVIDNVGHGNTECEDVANVTLRYPEGYAQFTASLVAPGQKQQLDFYTDAGYHLSIPWNPSAADVMPNGFPEEKQEMMDRLQEAYDQVPALELQAHGAQMRNFLKVIAGTEEPIATLTDGRQIIELITAIYKAAATHQEVPLPITSDDPFYTLEGKVAAMPHFHEKYVQVDRMGPGKMILAN